MVNCLVVFLNGQTFYSFAVFKTIILCSVHRKYFIKYVFSAKIWLVKTSTKTVKYESRVNKSNPVTSNNYSEKHIQYLHDKNTKHNTSSFFLFISNLIVITRCISRLSFYKQASKNQIENKH